MGGKQVETGGIRMWQEGGREEGGGGKAEQDEDGKFRVRKIVGRGKERIKVRQKMAGCDRRYKSVKESTR